MYESLTPDMVSWNSAISAGEKGKHWEEAHELLQEMMQRELTPDAVS